MIPAPPSPPPNPCSRRVVFHTPILSSSYSSSTLQIALLHDKKGIGMNTNRSSTRRSTTQLLPQSEFRTTRAFLPSGVSQSVSQSRMTCAFLYPNRNKRYKNRHTNNVCLFPSLLLLFFCPPTVMGSSSVHQHFKLGFCCVDGSFCDAAREEKKISLLPISPTPCWLQTCMEFHGSQALLKSQKKKAKVWACYKIVLLDRPLHE